MQSSNGKTQRLYRPRFEQHFCFQRRLSNNEFKKVEKNTTTLNSHVYFSHFLLTMSTNIPSPGPQIPWKKIVSVLSFFNEISSLISHSVPGAGWLYDENASSSLSSLLKILIDTISVGSCVVLGTIHAHDVSSSLDQILTTLVPVISAFIIPTLIMAAATDILTDYRLKLCIGIAIIFALTSTEDLSNYLIKKYGSWGFGPVLSLFLVCCYVHVVYARHKHTQIKFEYYNIKIYLLFVLLMGIIATQVYMYEFISETVKFNVNVTLVSLLFVFLIVLPIQNLASRRILKQKQTQ